MTAPTPHRDAVYTGIGSRSTPADICGIMTNMASFLAKAGYTLRSGGAEGADLAFESGATKKEIFLPWKGKRDGIVLSPEMQDAAMKIASRHHPFWPNLKGTSRLIHARNVAQVLGADLASPTHFVICWTVDGEFKGGTAMAMSVAKERDIPIFNLWNGALSTWRCVMEWAAMLSAAPPPEGG